jgi:LuxR family maltose regulon positive regulatory protein
VQLETILQGDSTLSADRRKMLQAHLDLLRGIFWFRQGEVQRASAYLQDALANLPAEHESSRAQAISFLAWAYSTTGQRAEGLTLLHTALAEDAAHVRATSIILMGACIIPHLYAGELGAAAQAARRVLALTDAARTPKAWQGVSYVAVWRQYAHYYWGAVCYERNDLAFATEHWRQVENWPPHLNSRAYHESLIGLALLAQARGSLTDALAYAQASSEFATELGNTAALASSEALITRLTLLNGQLVESLHRSEAIDTTVNLGTSHWLELPPLTRIRVLLAHLTTDSLTTALQIAEACLRQAEGAYNTRQIIQISALQSLVLHALRRQAEAFRVFERALSLAEPCGFVRTFLDLGAPMAALLSAFATQRGESEYTRSLLAAFSQAPELAQRRTLAAHYAKLHGITPLTPRERELLALIRQRRSIDEIAAALVISPNTVKKHANNIYTKLGVRNRREALAKAEELSLLPPA